LLSFSADVDVAIDAKCCFVL